MERVMETDYALTTFDNPFDPFEQFTSWYMFDVEQGYNTCGKLDRIANIRDDMTQKEKDAEIKRAIDVIITNDFLNIYKMKTRTMEIIEPMENNIE